MIPTFAEHCLELIKKWHDVRTDLEDKLFSLTKDKSISGGQAGSHRSDIFQGHCSGEGGESYIQIQGAKESFLKIPALY